LAQGGRIHGQILAEQAFAEQNLFPFAQKERRPLLIAAAHWRFAAPFPAREKI
jgi:hypothetical protein